MSESTRTVVIPYRPRPLQRVIHDGMEGKRQGVVVCHRRFGKTVCAVNHLQKSAMRCAKQRPRFGYIAPTYKQAKAVAWDYVKHFAGPVLDHGVNESELRIDYAQNQSQLRLFGADNPDSLRGLYFDGVVLDEYGLMPPTIFGEVIRPALSDRQGWALFLGTPNGKNQFYDVVQRARNESDWFLAEYRASVTNVLPREELEAARKMMTEDEYLQEYECSFEASVKGAVYARELMTAREQGRITNVPYEPRLPVDTAWDLGVGDATAIWFAQRHTEGLRLIDYYEASGEGLAHYAHVLEQKPYSYGYHYAPHDIEVRELGSGHSRLMIARQLGLNFQVTERRALEDGINAARMLLPTCWFDAEKCRYGIETLQHYRWDYNTRIHEFKPLPLHDWASHGADAFRTLALRHVTPKPLTRTEAERIDAKATRNAQKDKDPMDRPRGSSRGRSVRYSGARSRSGY